MLRCPVCSAPVNANSKFCNECGHQMNVESTGDNAESLSRRTYKLRSPILESAILYDDNAEKGHTFLTVTSYVFWAFTAAFVFYGIKSVYDTYTIDIYKGIVNGTLLFVLALFCFIIPGIISLLVNIEEHLAFLAKEAKKDKLE